jgi:hypothetical protein
MARAEFISAERLDPGFVVISSLSDYAVSVGLGHRTTDLTRAFPSILIHWRLDRSDSWLKMLRHRKIRKDQVQSRSEFCKSVGRVRAPLPHFSHRSAARAESRNQCPATACTSMVAEGLDNTQLPF